MFTYGSLMFDEVWQAVVGRLGDSTPGRLAEHEAWRIAGQTFPGMTPAPGHAVTGRIWRDVKPGELELLDAFESGIYERQRVTVETAGGHLCECWAYLVRREARGRLLNQAWDREEFRRRDLPTFLE